MSERTALGLRVGEGGICVDALGLWLDPPSAQPLAFVSHAHAARGLGSARALASPETLQIAAALGLASEGSRPLAWGRSVELPIARELGGGTARLSIAAAGHMLGAAQLVVDHPRGRLVYTGDWSPYADATHAAGAVVECDELVLTTTFALPIFRFAPPVHVLRELSAWCAERLTQEATPIVLAQTPGAAQSIVRELNARGIPVAAPEEVRRACEAYRTLGVDTGEVSAFGSAARGGDSSSPSARRHRPSGAVVAPASTRATELRARGPAAVAYASGWALLDAAVEQKRADAAFTLADHADYDGLVALVRATGARRVVCTRGEARAFAHVLRESGIEAEALELPAVDERGSS